MWMKHRNDLSSLHARRTQDTLGVRQIKLLAAGLLDPSAKVQQAAVNMLNQALSLPDLPSRARALLQVCPVSFGQ